jgi:hypothetical protein
MSGTARHWLAGRQDDLDRTLECGLAAGHIELDMHGAVRSSGTDLKARLRAAMAIQCQTAAIAGNAATALDANGASMVG